MVMGEKKRGGKEFLLWGLGSRDGILFFLSLSNFGFIFLESTLSTTVILLD